MDKYLKVLLFVFISLIAFSANAAGRYLLNAGDILDISVWNEDALKKQVTVLPDGTISFPLAGELQAEGKSVADLQTELKTKLAKFLADPVVTVSVSSVEGNRVHILGKVASPGSFKMSQPLDVLQALSLAGGLSTYAEENNIIVIRRNGDKQQIFHFRYADIKKGQDLNSNIILQSGDVIVVP